MNEDEELISAEEQMSQLSRRGFLWAAFAALGATGLVAGIQSSRSVHGMKLPLRRVNELNGELWQRLFRDDSRAPEFDPALASARYNSDIGLHSDLDMAKWHLRVEGLRDGNREFTLDELRAMPRVEQTTELKCIEGWSVITTFAGVRFIDFAHVCGPQTRSGVVANVRSGQTDVAPYVWMETPDGKYFVGLDTPSALHPQTVLAYEMNGEPLLIKHGAPLRLVIPVKYGIKNIKRIGRIRFSMSRPRDYWYEDGYDWFAGL